MENEERDDLFNEIKNLKTTFLETQEKAYDVLAEAALILPKAETKKLFEQQTSEHLSVLMDKIGLEKENYEICQIIKDVLDSREPDYDKKHEKPSPSAIKKEMINGSMRLSQTIPVEGVIWHVSQVSGDENYVSVVKDAVNLEQPEEMKFGSWDEAFEYFQDLDMQLALIQAALDFISSLLDS